MSEDSIAHKQRIIFLGQDAKAIIGLTSKIFKTFDKEHDVIYSDSSSLSDAPMVLIENQWSKIEHHILVVGNISDEEIALLDTIADKTPKAGAIVFPIANKKIKKICSTDRPDVIQLPYKKEKPVGDYTAEQVAGARALLTRLRVQKNQFDNALASL